MKSGKGVEANFLKSFTHNAKVLINNAVYGKISDNPQYGKTMKNDKQIALELLHNRTDCSVSYRQSNNGLKIVAFLPKPGHEVWLGAEDARDILLILGMETVNELEKH